MFAFATFVFYTRFRDRLWGYRPVKLEKRSLATVIRHDGLLYYVAMVGKLTMDSRLEL